MGYWQKKIPSGRRRNYVKKILHATTGLTKRTKLRNIYYLREKHQKRPY